LEVPNTQLVVRRGDLIIVRAPCVEMSIDEALVHAAWLVAITGAEDRFPAILTEVEKT